jgi:hypothetical protein
MTDYTFTIKTPAELSGVESAIERFERLRGQAKANGKDFADLDTKIAAAKASIEAYNSTIAATAAPTAKATDDTEAYAKALEKMDHAAHEAKAEAAQLAIEQQQNAAIASVAAQNTDDLGKETETASGKFKLFAGQGEAVKKVLNQISQDSPALGLALRAVISPVGATITAAGLIFRAFKKDIDDLNAKLDTMAAEGAKPLSDFASAFRNAVNESNSSTGTFIKKVDDLATAAGRVKTNAANAVEQIQRLANAELEFVNANQAKAVAQVNLDEQRGNINRVEAVNRRQQITEFYQQQAQSINRAKEQAEITVKQNQISATEKNLNENVQVAGTPAAALERKSRIEDKSNLSANAKERLKLLEEQRKAAQAELDEQDRQVSNAELLIKKGGPIAVGLGAGDELIAAKKRRDQTKVGLDDVELSIRQTTRLRDDAAAQVSALTNQQEASQKATDKVRELREELTKLATELQTLKDAASPTGKIGGLRSATEKTEAETRALNNKAETERAEDGQIKNLQTAPPRPVKSPSFSLGPVPDPTPEFLAYHKEVVSVMTDLKRSLADARSSMSDTSNNV